jgi:hypothetical protein
MYENSSVKITHSENLRNKKAIVLKDMVAFVTNPIFNDLIEEAGEDLFSYLTKYHLILNQNFIVLSSIRHYLYHSQELQNVHLIINLKIINSVKNVSYFLCTMKRILPMKGYLVGCFVDYSNQKKIIRKRKYSLLGCLSLVTNVFLNRSIPNARQITF